MARKFGVELEIIGGTHNMQAVAQLLTSAGIECGVESYNHARRENWKIVGDGSLSGRNAMELVSPPLKGRKGIAQVATVAQVLMRAGIEVNNTCGLHVHVEARELSLEAFKNVAKLVTIHEEHIKTILPQSRRVTRWAVWPSVILGGNDVASRCAKIDRVNSVRELCQLWGNDRYRAVNFEALSRHNTIEFRSHSGSVDANKITAWVSLCVGLVRNADRPEAITPIWGCGKPRCFQDVVRFAGKKHERFFFDRRQQLSNAAAA